MIKRLCFFISFVMLCSAGMLPDNFYGKWISHENPSVQYEFKQNNNTFTYHETSDNNVDCSIKNVEWFKSYNVFNNKIWFEMYENKIIKQVASDSNFIHQIFTLENHETISISTSGKITANDRLSKIKENLILYYIGKWVNQKNDNSYTIIKNEDNFDFCFNENKQQFYFTNISYSKKYTHNNNNTYWFNTDGVHLIAKRNNTNNYTIFYFDIISNNKMKLSYIISNETNFIKNGTVQLNKNLNKFDSNYSGHWIMLSQSPLQFKFSEVDSNLNFYISQSNKNCNFTNVIFYNKYFCENSQYWWEMNSKELVLHRQTNNTNTQYLFSSVTDKTLTMQIFNESNKLLDTITLYKLDQSNANVLN